jgi:hypothetical protein
MRRCVQTPFYPGTVASTYVTMPKAARTKSCVIFPLNSIFVFSPFFLFSFFRPTPPFYPPATPVAARGEAFRGKSLLGITNAWGVYASYHLLMTFTDTDTDDGERG